MKIVIVDDEKIILEGIKRTILKIYPNFEINCFLDSNDAVNFIKKNSCDVVLMDIQMPEISGIELAKRIKGIKEDITRAELVELLWKIAKQPEVDCELSFNDVLETDGFVGALRWAYSNGIISGIDECTFAPYEFITREQLATILYKYAKLHGKGFGELWMFRLEYVDTDMISDYAYEPICWLIMNNVINGVDNEHISPKTTVTRAQLAVMVQKFLPLLDPVTD